MEIWEQVQGGRNKGRGQVGGEEEDVLMLR